MLRAILSALLSAMLLSAVAEGQVERRPPRTMRG